RPRGRWRAPGWTSSRQRRASARRGRARSIIISIPADEDRNLRHRLRAADPWRAWRGGAADDARARAAGGLCPRGARAADAAGADRRQYGPGAAVVANRYAAAAGGGRTDPQPRPVAVGAAARGGDRVGNGADRDRAARGT